MNDGKELREAIDAVADQALDDALSHVFGAAPEARSDVGDMPSKRVGRYKLLEQIGEGGFGVVYMAEQEEPIRRRVALKIIKLGMDTKQVVARFEAERQALAMMEHENIASVLDAGTTETGRPFFVMELVRGVPITDYCNRNKLDTRDRLQLFIAVCNAVQHAHQKGIIHRDLKPSNVMVTLRDGAPIPKVIDFGVAKATQARLTEKTVYTRYGQFIGTPAYMSPEQVEMSEFDVDTRSDIYSLGVLLYELLTGTTPLSREHLRNAGYSDLQRMICEEEPPKPSTRLSQSGETLAAISSQRATEPKRLGRMLRGELDWIVMKALEKDRTRRYETANGLAMDVRRYLNDEPVLASPPSAAYVMRKFARKFKRALATAAAFLILLLLCAIVSSVLAIQAAQQATRANEAESTANDERDAALDAQARAEFERNRAVQAEADAEFERDRAIEAEELAELRREQTESSLYFARIALAQLAWEASDIRGTLEMLRRCEPQSGEIDRRGWEWYYLYRLCNSEDQRFTDHTSGGVHGVAYSRDGQWLASSGGGNLYYANAGVVRPGEVIIRDTQTGEISHVLQGHANVVTGIAFSPDSSRLATAGHDDSVKIWDVETGEELISIETSAWNVAFSPDGKHLATIFGDVQVWRLEPLELASTYSHRNEEPFPTITFHPTRNELAIASDMVIQVYDTTTDELLHEYPGVSPVAYSPTGDWLACGTRDGELRIYNTVNQEPHATFSDTDGIRSIAFDPQSERVAAAGNDRVIRFWNLASREPLHMIRGSHDVIHSLAIHPDGEFVASACQNGSLSVWKTNADPSAALVDGWGWDIMFGRDDLISIATRSGSLSIDTTNQHKVSQFTHDVSQAARWPRFDFALSGDGSLMAAAMHLDPSVIGIWDVETGREVQRFRGHEGEVVTVTVSHDQRLLASVATIPNDDTPESTYYEIKIWDITTGEETDAEIRNLLRFQTGIAALAFSHDGAWLALADVSILGNGIRVWNTTTGESEFELPLPEGSLPVQMTFRHDDLQLAVADGAQSIVHVFDIEARQPLFELPGPKTTCSVAFSPDGRRLVAAGYESEIPIWDTTTGTPVLVLNRLGPRAGTAGQNPRVVFSRDGSRIITTNYDASLTLWDARAAQ